MYNISLVARKEIIAKNIAVMDSTAVTLCMDNNIPILVFNMEVEGNIVAVLEGKIEAGTIVRAD